MNKEKRQWEIEEELEKKKSLSNVRVDEDDILDLAANLNKSEWKDTNWQS